MGSDHCPVILRLRPEEAKDDSGLTVKTEVATVKIAQAEGAGNSPSAAQSSS